MPHVPWCRLGPCAITEGDGVAHRPHGKARVHASYPEGSTLKRQHWPPGRGSAPGSVAGWLCSCQGLVCLPMPQAPTCKRGACWVMSALCSSSDLGLGGRSCCTASCLRCSASGISSWVPVFHVLPRPARPGLRECVTWTGRILSTEN